MKFLKKIGSVLLKTLIGFVLLIAFYIIIAFITTIIPINTNYKMPERGSEIWISSNGVHTNIIVPSNSSVIDWKTFLKLKNECKYIAFGWGEKEFYMNTPTWADVKFGTALKAAFWFNEALVQVYCPSSKPEISDQTKKIILTDKQAKELNSYIYSSFSLNTDGSVVELIPAKGPGNHYKYYKAKGKYSMFKTCNNWTSKGLKQAGVKNALWAPFDRSVLYHLK